METWLIVAIVVALVVAALLAVLARRRGRLRRPTDEVEQRPEAELRASTVDGPASDSGAAADLGAGSDPGAAPEPPPQPADPDPAVVPVAPGRGQNGQPASRTPGSGPDADGPGIADLPTPPVGGRVLGGEAAPDIDVSTVRLPVRGRRSEPVDAAGPTRILPIIGRRRRARAAAEQSRHARPDDDHSPAPVASTNGGGGRHRAPSEAPEPDRPADHQRTEPYGGPVIPDARRPEPPAAVAPPAIPQQDAGPPPASPEASPSRSRSAGGPPPLPTRTPLNPMSPNPMSPNPMPPNPMPPGPMPRPRDPGLTGPDLFGAATPANPASGNGNGDGDGEEPAEGGRSRTLANRLLGRKW